MAKGLSLQALALRMKRPVTRAALSKYELGQATPRPTVLMDLGHALGVRPAYLLAKPREEPTSIHWVAYRKHPRIGAQVREQIQARAEELSEAYLHLLGQLHPGEEPNFPPARRATTEDAAESCAVSLREFWHLGAGPIERLVSRVEDAGALVVEGPSSGGFEAVSGRTDSGRPVIVLNLARPADRVRFSLGHELGHLLLECKGLAPKREEALANRFAAAFLVPADAARRELGHGRTHLSRTELEELELKYGVSMQFWTRRARDLGIVTDSNYRSWQIRFRSRNLHVRESVDFAGGEAPRRMHLLAAQAFAEHLIDREWMQHHHLESAEPTTDMTAGTGETSARSLLALPPEERARVLLEQARAAAHEYAQTPKETEWLEFDDTIAETVEDSE
jgi:Zn-dependent peptidase ImmA (M78 family)